MFQVKRKETINKTLRFPLSLLARLDIAANQLNVSVSSLVFQACDYALHSLEKGERKKW